MTFLSLVGTLLCLAVVAGIREDIGFLAFNQTDYANADVWQHRVTRKAPVRAMSLVSSIRQRTKFH